MSTQALYDFDGTITTKDTTILLLVALLKLRPWRFSGLIWLLLRMIVASDSVSKQGHKNKAIGYLIKDLSDMRLSGALKDFRNKVKFLYRPSVVASIDQAIEDANKFSGKDLKNNFKFIDGDIGKLDVCNEACYGVDYVLHQAALGSVPRSIKDPISTNRANIDGFLNMLVASKDANVKRFVYGHQALPTAIIQTYQR